MDWECDRFTDLNMDLFSIIHKQYFLHSLYMVYLDDMVGTWHLSGPSMGMCEHHQKERWISQDILSEVYK